MNTPPSSIQFSLFIHTYLLKLERGEAVELLRPLVAMRALTKQVLNWTKSKTAEKAASVKKWGKGSCFYSNLSSKKSPSAISICKKLQKRGGGRDVSLH